MDADSQRDIAVEYDTAQNSSSISLLTRLRGIGSQIAAVLYLEGLYRHFGNRREVAAYAGLVPTPWRGGTIDREQGISKPSNPRLRHIMVELAWLWVHQPDSALARGFRARVGAEKGRVRRIQGERDQPVDRSDRPYCNPAKFLAPSERIFHWVGANRPEDPLVTRYNAVADGTH